MREEIPKKVQVGRWSRRRLLTAGSMGAAAAVLGARALPLPEFGPEHIAGKNSNALSGTLAEFIGALFGRSLTAADRDDLLSRLEYLFAVGGPIAADCALLTCYVDRLAADLGSKSFSRLNDEQKAGIVDQVMQIDPKSVGARLLMHFSADERAFYRMRWSAVPQLAWLYRHSAGAWKARGYTRWPGIAGDWRESLQPGPAYP